MCKGLDMPKYTLHNSQLHSFTASQLHRGIVFFLHIYIIIFSHQRMHKEQNDFSMRAPLKTSVFRGAHGSFL